MRLRGSCEERLALAEAKCERLQIENEELQESMRQLEAECLGTSMLLPLSWQLTGSEAALVACIISNPIMTKAMAMHALYAMRHDDAAALDKIVDVLVCKARKKLAAQGIKIETRWGVGYFMTEAMRQRCREEVEAEAATSGR